MTELGPTITELEPTATERLRALLTERGVEWRKTPHYSSESQDNETVFEGTGIEWCANDHLNGRLGLRTARYEVTPEQAIEATLGSCNCSNSERTSDSDATAERRGDAVEVVRCGDCKHYTDDEMEYYHYCGSWCEQVTPDGYCAWGERKECVWTNGY